jgi:hypothetical protein
MRAGDGEDVGVAFADAAGLDAWQPVTMTLPFSARASPMASSDSSLALFKKPQVLTTTASAPS